MEYDVCGMRSDKLRLLNHGECDPRDKFNRFIYISYSPLFSEDSTANFRFLSGANLTKGREGVVGAFCSI